ncbi:MAG: transposase [Thermodesulfobacteriota bacterium]|nr:transposase [Thermodesulfobacteriota bacterium]
MARPLRIEYSGAVYHVTSRGNARERIFVNDADRQVFLEIMATVIKKYNWLCHSYCLMDNHYHVLLETSAPNLSLGMRQLNGMYTQRFNRQHDRVGHVFQGRYKAILVEKNEHLLELCRYIILNPVRAGMESEPKKWVWSSYQATAYSVKVPEFLTVDWILGQFARTKNKARKGYRKFVADGIANPKESPWKKLVGQIVLGGSDFVADIQSRLSEVKEIGEIPRAQRFPGRPPLGALFFKKAIQDKTVRNKQIEAAHMQYSYTLKEIADQLKIHYTTVSKVLKSC